AVSTFSSACDATICPIGAASGGEPTSSRTRSTSSITSSRRSPAACARSYWSDWLVADVLVDEIRGGPEEIHVDARRESETRQRLSCRLRRDTVHRQGDGVHRRGDH